MSAQIFDFPDQSKEAQRIPIAAAPGASFVMVQMMLPEALYDRLTALGDRMRCSDSRAAEALVIFGLARAERKSLEEFTDDLCGKPGMVQT